MTRGTVTVVGLLLCAAGRAAAAQVPVRDSLTSRDSVATRDSTAVRDSTAKRDTTATRDTSTSRWLSGLTLSLPSQNGQTSGEFVGIGYSGMLAQPNRIGPDLSLTVFPRFIAYGALLAGARFNIGVPITLGRNVFFMPSAGLTAVAAAGVGGGTMTTGYNGTLALVLLEHDDAGKAAKYGFRVGLSLHRFTNDDGPMLRVIELGLVKR